MRLFHGRDTDYKKNKLGTGTTSEIQLIGRGVRYYPFAYGEKIKNRRKFDNDTNHELRVLEEFYFHSDNDEKYLSDLKIGLEKENLIQSTKIEKKFTIKKNWQAELSKMYLFCNKKIENPNRKLKTLPEDFSKLNFPFTFEARTSYITNVNMNDELQLENEIVAGGSSKTIHISELLKNYLHVIYKALHSLNSDCTSYFSFENLRHGFNVNGMEEFLRFIEPIPLELTFKDGKNLDTEEPQEILKMLKEFFLYCQRELEKYDMPFNASGFELVPFENCFPFETTRMVDTASDDKAENEKYERNCQQFSWYALDSFWGTSEERNLVDFINNRIENLKTKYNEICLLRNEEVYKIFDFESGQGFQPDFLLLLREQSGKDLVYFQVFIEPKGKYLAGEDNDGWKEKFLLDISTRYGLEKPIEISSGKYKLFGLPFFNQTDAERRSKFNERFNELFGDA